MKNTLPTQSLPQNPPPSSTHDPSLFNQNHFSSSSLPPIPSISQTTSSNTQSTSYNPYLSLYPTFQNFPTNSFQPPPNPPHIILTISTSSNTQSTSYNPYLSLYPTFQNFPTNSFQPPPNPPHPIPPTSTVPFNSSSLYSSLHFPTTPSVPFAALSDPIKLFDGLDHTYPPEKFLAHLRARVTFQLGPQPVDIQSYLTWHSRRMSLLYCSLTRTAANWYDRLPQVYKDDWSSFLQIFKKQFYSQKHAYHAQIEALSLVKRHFALKVETLVKQGWYNEYPSTINLKCNEIFTRGLPKKLKDSANKRQVRHISNSFEPSIPFHSLVNMVDSEDITLQSISSFLNKYKKPVRNKVETLLQENPCLNETDLYDTDDPVLKRIPQQHSQPSHELHTLFTEIQHHYFNDIYFF